MTREAAQLVLLKAFLATGELPDDLAELLTALLNVRPIPIAPRAPQ